MRWQLLKVLKSKTLIQIIWFIFSKIHFLEKYTHLLAKNQDYFSIVPNLGYVIAPVIFQTLFIKNFSFI